MDDRHGRPRTLPALAAQPPSAAPHASAPMARADAKRARGLRALQGRVQPEGSERFSAVGPASGGAGGAAPAAQKRSTTASFAHIFFNRRPLELLKRTSTLLTAGGRSASRGDGKSAAGAMGAAPMPLPHATESIARPPVPATTVRVRADPAAGERVPSTPHLPDSEYRQLTAYERHEVKAYDRVLYCSTLRLKAQRRGGQVVAALPVHPDDDDEDEDPALEDAALERELPNFGFDDSQGDYLVVLGDHLAFRYEVQRALGRGAFGQVVECTDHATQRRVAVKIVRNRPKYAAQAAVEAQLLARVAHSNAHNVVRFLERFTFRRHVCLVFELLGPNLYDALRLRFFKGFPMRTVRGVARQLVLALRSLQELDVVHCDLKPENVLICSHVADDTNDECSHVSCSHVTYDTRSDQAMDVKLIDFGSACVPTTGAMFTYVQSRFYRSPEVLLGHAYSTPIDMWSLACVLVELHGGHPLFAGENETEQLHCILEVLGAPPVAFLEQCKRRRQFFDEVNGGGFVAKPFVNSRGRRRVVNSRSLKAAAQSDDAAFLAFLARCLEWDPARRLTPHEALLDPWLARD